MQISRITRPQYGATQFAHAVPLRPTGQPHANQWQGQQSYGHPHPVWRPYGLDRNYVQAWNEYYAQQAMRYNYNLQQYPQLNAAVRSSPQVQVPAHNAYHNQGSARYQPYRMPQHAGSYLNRGAQYQNGSQIDGNKQINLCKCFLLSALCKYHQHHSH